MSIAVVGRGDRVGTVESSLTTAACQHQEQETAQSAQGNHRPPERSRLLDFCFYFLQSFNLFFGQGKRVLHKKIVGITVSGLQPAARPVQPVHNGSGRR